MRRVLPLVVLAALAGAGATAIAQSGGKATNAYTLQEPSLGDATVLHMAATSQVCDGRRSVTVRVTPPLGAILGGVRVRVDGREMARLTGVPRAASATVRVPLSGARVTATAETLGGQRVKVSRVYADCRAPAAPAPAVAVAAAVEEAAAGARRRTRARPRRAWRARAARAAPRQACARPPAR